MNLPRDTAVRYFVEQQLRRQPGGNWLGFADPRLPAQQQTVVEVPKWWSICSWFRLLMLIFFSFLAFEESLLGYENKEEE